MMKQCVNEHAAARAGPWKVTTHGGHGFAPEFPPVGMPSSPPPPLPRTDGDTPRIVGALASSYMWSELMQARGTLCGVMQAHTLSESRSATTEPDMQWACGHA